MNVWYQHRLRVRYQETDKMGVVFHGNYLNWFEIGRTEWIRSRGRTYKALEDKGLLLPVVDLQAQFHQPAHYDEIVRVYTRLKSFDRLRMTFETQIRRHAEDQVAGADQIYFVDEHRPTGGFAGGRINPPRVAKRRVEAGAAGSSGSGFVSGTGR